jgi:starch synthase
MKILMVSPEVAPYSKVGGLGDVVGALSKALAALGHDVRVVTPLYGFIRPAADWVAFPHVLSVHLGHGREEFCRVWQVTPPGSGAQVDFIEFARYFDRPGIYGSPGGGYADNPERYAFLCRAAIDWCYASQWFPDVVHSHDWTAALAPIYLNTTDRHRPLGRSASIFTIHNLQYQGYSPRALLDFAGLPAALFTPDNLESYGELNWMKGGLYHATKITTVSHNYAREIQSPEGSCGLHNVLRYRSGDLIGVVNGIDPVEWNPAIDPHLPANFSAADLSGKAVCKAELQQHFGLTVSATAPLFAAVARFADQKGLDLLAAIVPSLVEQMDLQIVVLGTGDPRLEEAFRNLARLHPGRVGAFIGFDEGLAHRIEAGADFFVMPSRFEPCGLNQMYSQAYGTPPIVRATGGLVDTVEPFVEGQGLGTGFLFHEPSGPALFHAITWAASVFHQRPDDLLALRRNGMAKDFSWTRSARRYAEIYGWAVEQRLRA